MNGRNHVPEPSWKVPWPYGYPAAVQMAGSVAAPLLAGFSITMVGVVIGYSRNIRWAGIAMLLLSIAAGLLIFSVQAAFSARAWQLDPTELSAWWPDDEDRPDLAVLKGWQEIHYTRHRRWATAFQISYNVGLVFLLVGLASCIAPPSAEVGTDRWVAAIVAAAVAMLEAGWIGIYWYRAMQADTGNHATTETGRLLGAADLENHGSGAGPIVRMVEAFSLVAACCVAVVSWVRSRDPKRDGASSH